MSAFKDYTFNFYDAEGNLIRQNRNWAQGEQLQPSTAISMARGLSWQYLAAKVVVYEGREETGEPFFTYEPELPPEKEPWKIHSVYRRAVEYLPIKFVEQFMGNAVREDKIQRLMQDIEQRGFERPLTLNVGQEDHHVYLGEGNHRLEVARRLQMDTVPVYVALYREVRSPSSGFDVVEYPYLRAGLTRFESKQMYRPSDIFESYVVVYRRLGSVAIKLDTPETVA